MKLLLSVLSTYERGGWYCPELVWWVIHASQTARNLGIEIDFKPAHAFNPAAAARNLLGKSCAEGDFDWLLMIDNDMVPPANLLEILTEATEEHDIILPVFHCYERDNRRVGIVWHPLGWGERLKSLGLKDAPAEWHEEFMRQVNGQRWVPLDGGGTGCIFIRKRVFQGLPYPWFRYKYNQDWLMIATEDVPFIQDAVKAGFKCWGHTGYTVGHNHTVNLAEFGRVLTAGEPAPPNAHPAKSVPSGEAHCVESAVQ